MKGQDEANRKVSLRDKEPPKVGFISPKKNILEHYILGKYPEKNVLDTKSPNKN